MYRKLLSNTNFVKAQSASLDFVVSPPRNRREAVR